MIRTSMLYSLVLLIVGLYYYRRIGPFVSTRAMTLLYFLVLCGPVHIGYSYTAGIGEPLFNRLSLALAAMWIGLLAGMEIAQKLMPRALQISRKVSSSWRQTALRDDLHSGRLFAATALVCTVLIWSFADEGFISRLATFLTLAGDTNAVAELRGTVGGSRYYVVNLTVSTLGPLIGFMWLGRSLVSRKPQDIMIAIVVLAIVSLSKAGLLNRSALAIFLCQVGLVVWFRHDNRIRLFPAIIGVSLLAILVYPFYVHYLGDLTVSEFLGTYFLDRVFLAPYYAIYSYFEYYPDLIPYAWGRNISIVNNLFYGGVAYEVAMFRFALDAGNTLGSYNAMFPAEAWVDFSYPGVAIAALVAGLACSFADALIFRNGTTVSGTAMLAAALYGVFAMSATAIQTALWSGGLLLSPVIGQALRRRRTTHADRTPSTLARRPTPPGHRELWGT